VPYGITQCYLPPGRGDIPVFTPAEAGTLFSDPVGMQGRVDLGTAIKVRSPCLRLHITVSFAINTAVGGDIGTVVLSCCSRARHCATTLRWTFKQ